MTAHDRCPALTSLRVKAATALGLALFLTLASTGVSMAAWSTGSTVTVSASAATTQLAIAGVEDLTHDYTRPQKSVATVTVSNTGTAPLTYSLGVAGAAGNLASTVSLTIWTKPKGKCATGQGKDVGSGTLQSPPALPAEATSAAPGSDIALCVMTSLDDISGLAGLGVTGVFTITGMVGNWSTSVGAAFTQSVPDGQKPTKPGTSAAVNVATSSLTLVWAASTDDVGVTGYEIIRDGKSIGTSSSTAFTDGAVVAGKTYSYKVRAVDAAGNVSTASTALKVTTPTSDPSLWYQVVDPNSGMCVDGFKELTADGTPLIVYPCKPTVMNNQAWRFTPNLDGTFTVIAGYGTNPVWSVADGTVSAELWAPAAATAQRWTLVPVDGAGTFQFVAGGGSCLTVPAASTVSETRLIQDACTAGAGQVFALVEVP